MLTDIYRAFSDVTRLRMVQLISHKPLCVSELQRLLDLDQVRASKHLGYLRKRGVLVAVRDRNRVIYRLPDPTPTPLATHIECLNECIRGIEPFAGDLARFEAFESAMVLPGTPTPPTVSPEPPGPVIRTDAPAPTVADPAADAPASAPTAEPASAWVGAEARPDEGFID